MIRPVAADGRIDAGGAFTPILRPRVVERITAAGFQRVVLIVAPAGYGKSVALRQFLDSVEEAHVRYDVHAEHASLLGFVRGFADALLDVAPDARKTVSGAYEKSRSSRTPGSDLAMWMHAHVKTFLGLIAIDDLHLTENDPEISKFLVSLIERTKGRTRWVIASRSSLDLPVASWLAYGDMDLTIDEEDLKFTADEARSTAKASRVGVRDEELHEILEMTGGWPTALSFALRTSTRSVDLRNIAATTREMVYRYLAEQVYRLLTEEERDFLHFAASLPEIDLEVLRAAGYENGRATVEALRDRVAFIYADRPGVYRCHDLFRDFVVHQLELRGDAATQAVHMRVAVALESAGHTSSALALYTRGRAAAEMIRMLGTHGFALMEQGHADTVMSAIDALPQDVRATDGVVLGLRAANESDGGRLDRAEALFERAALKTPPAMAPGLAIRHALVLVNQGKNPALLLEPLIERTDLDAATLGEMSAILAAAFAFVGPQERAGRYLERAVALVPAVESEDVRAKMLQRIGFSYLYLGELEKAREYQTRAAKLAVERGLFSLAARAYTVLVRVASDEADAPRELWSAQQAANMAGKAGDRFTLLLALLQMLHVETRRGSWERVETIQSQLAQLSSMDASRSAAIVTNGAIASASRGQFEDAYRAFAPVLERAQYERDRLLDSALAGLCAIALNRRQDALNLVASTLKRIESADTRTHGAKLDVEIARALCAIVEAFCGRATAASKILNRRSDLADPAAQCLIALGQAILRALKAPIARYEVQEYLNSLQSLGLGGYGRVVEMAFECIGQSTEDLQATVLTRAEVAVLRGLAEGKSPKELAAESNRSVYTVQAHIQNAIGKLGCSGRSEALAIARKKGFLA
ncbi:MAG TPA: LuxR C-terminal-related transcriptional regulator [Candidatus Baltobacteraceae bacterium]|jgi:LuxR family maltose regulon positive regulatory protein